MIINQCMLVHVIGYFSVLLYVVHENKCKYDKEKETKKQRNNDLRLLD